MIYQMKKFLFQIHVIILTGALLVACGSKKQGNSAEGQLPGAKTENESSSSIKINGAGSTFDYPIFSSRSTDQC